MSVTTESQKKRDEAKENLEKAYSNVIEALSPATQGHDDWNDHYVDTLHEIASQILKLKRRI